MVHSPAIRSLAVTAERMAGDELRVSGHGGGQQPTGGRLYGRYVPVRCPSGFGGRQLAAGDDVDVDAERACLPDDPHDVGAAAGELLPPAALAGADHDLSDLVLPGEFDDGLRGIVILYLVPAGADVRGQLL
jgi:hypothetical protein